jgi:DNA-binding response OmpR family regulator
MAKILVAEDEKQIGDMIAFKLSNSGHQVVRAPDGEQALTLASRELPDLILLDAMMPGGERLRSSPAPQGGFLVASDPGDHGDGKRTRRDVLNGLRGGAVDYIVKPFSLKELSVRVELALRREPPAI